MYTIKHAAEQLGVSVSTLRAWESRYGVGAARRTESGYRLYDDEALRALSLMNALVNDGWSVRAAAEETLRRTAAQDASPPTGPEGWAPEDDDALVRAAAEMDAAALSTALDHRFSTASFETVVDGWLLPSLRNLGGAWEAGTVSVAGEHFASHAVTRRLSGAYDAAGGGQAGPHVVLGLAPGSRHDLGLLSFATAARRAGLTTSYLGADVPIDDWVATVTATQPDCVVIAVPMAEDAPAVARTVEALEALPGKLVIAVGGSAQDLAPERCLRLGHRLGPAAALLAHALGRRVSPD